MGPVVSNASPLIALQQIGVIDLLRELFNTVIVPPSVAAETANAVPPLPWLSVHPLVQPVAPRITAARLDPGEREVFGLAIESGARLTILDERPARRLAERFGLTITGTAGVLVLARQRRLLPVVRPQLDALITAGFYLAPAVYRAALVLAGETP